MLVDRDEPVVRFGSEQAPLRSERFPLGDVAPPVDESRDDRERDDWRPEDEDAIGEPRTDPCPEPWDGVVAAGRELDRHVLIAEPEGRLVATASRRRLPRWRRRRAASTAAHPDRAPGP